MKWSWQWMSFHKNRGMKGQLHNTYWDAFVIQKNYGKHVNNLYEHILTWDFFLDKGHELTWSAL